MTLVAVVELPRKQLVQHCWFLQQLRVSRCPPRSVVARHRIGPSNTGDKLRSSNMLGFVCFIPLFDGLVATRTPHTRVACLGRSLSTLEPPSSWLPQRARVPTEAWQSLLKTSILCDQGIDEGHVSLSGVANGWLELPEPCRRKRGLPKQPVPFEDIGMRDGTARGQQ